MGSSTITARETANRLAEQGENVGVLSVHLFRPFSIKHFLQALPLTVHALAVLDRTKEPGSVGEPLYLDVVAALHESGEYGDTSPTQMSRIIGGRYGLG